ncbi:enoyl-CoA hydratase [Gordonia sp. DT218]|uniref:enoyl-CoA hydratase n=1 Tax=Gordonia sp. DT218 TaxID=3416659 RepID=UPI003CE8843C
MGLRKICVLLSVMLVGALSWLGVGTAAADRPLPKVSQYSDNIGTFGDHDFCHGAFNVGLSTPTGKRGIVRVTLTSFGFTGNAPGWKRNPKCRFLVNLNHTGSAVFSKDMFVPVAFGPRPGQKVQRDLRTGSGVAWIAVATYAANNPVRALQSYGSAFYTVVP